MTKNTNEIYYLLLNNQLALMGEQLGGSMKVEKIFPDTVTFVFDQKSQKNSTSKIKTSPIASPSSINLTEK
jgi:hypothetical protein